MIRINDNPLAVAFRAGASAAALGCVLGLPACDKKEPKKKKQEATAPGRTSTPVATSPAPASSAWRVAPLPQTWTFSGFTEDKDLSGIAAWDERQCLVCTDEKHDILPGVMDRTAGTVTASGGFPLLQGAAKKTETDTEGVAVARQDGGYYVTGSHGVAKKSGELQESRCHVFLIPVHTGTGEAGRGDVKVGSLTPWLEKNEVLAPHVGKDLQHDGFNIEGLAFKDGQLWFGVRAPNIGGDTFVIEAKASSIFGNATQAKLHRLSIGAGLGIREIAALRDGFLVLTGESNSDVGPDNEFRFYHWKPGSAPEFIGLVPSPSAKAEGLMVLDEKAGLVDVLVIFDSAPQGGPKAYRLTRP